MTDLFPLVGFILAAAMTAVAFFSWRKAVSFHMLLAESSNRFAAMRSKNMQLAAEVEQAQQKALASRDTATRLEKSLAVEKEKSAVLAADLQAATDKQNNLLHSYELKLEHLNTQVDALTQQLREADYERKEAEKRLSYTDQDRSDKLAAAKQALDQEVETWKKKVRLIENEFSQFRQQAERQKKASADVDPEVMRDVKRKVIHFESLYKSMRGLREMADERNKNWEIALRRLSAYVLRHSESKSLGALETAPLGPMVGEALELIGAKLVDDDEGDDMVMAVAPPLGKQKEL